MFLNFYLHCVYRVYSRPLLSATITLNLVSGDLKQIFSSEMDKNDIYLGGVSKQNTPFFRKFALKNALMSPISESVLV